jgi:aquaglyceroporin related protein
LSINIGWAIGTALGVWVSGGISGGHINPAVSYLFFIHIFIKVFQVTLALATFRGFPWKKVPVSLPFSFLCRDITRPWKVYILAQILGGVVGAGVIYANYIHAIDIFEGGRGVRTLATAGLFSTYTVSDVSL